MDDIVEILKALGEENRLRILLLIEQAGELSVADIGNALELAQPKVSRHLARLRLAGWVKERRWRGFALYRIVLPPGDIHREFLLQLSQKMENDPVAAADLQRLISIRKMGASQNKAETSSETSAIEE